VLVLQLDVTREEAIQPALDAALERFGRIDVLVNNAGIGFVGALEEMTRDGLRRAMETMFFGPAALTQAVLPQMRAQGSGTIVQISSQGGRMAGPGVSAYCAAKFALEGLSEAVAGEVAPFGVRVLIVEPGNFRTGLLGSSLHTATPIEAYATTVGVTHSYFASEDGRQLHPLLIGTGRRLFADGGQSASLALIESTTTSTGVVIARYETTTSTP
jgi:NAD(P)-dependent dehydrogenase (short-subunit alcohol dehydrogenase family)